MSRAKKAVPHHVYAAAVIINRGRVLLARRPPTGLLGGMWEFPSGEVGSAPRRLLAKTIRKLYDVRVRCSEPLGVVRHGYSHFTVEVHSFLCEAVNVPKRRGLRWVSLAALEDFPMGRVDRQIARHLRHG